MAVSEVGGISGAVKRGITVVLNSLELLFLMTQIGQPTVLQYLKKLNKEFIFSSLSKNTVIPRYTAPDIPPTSLTAII